MPVRLPGCNGLDYEYFFLVKEGYRIGLDPLSSLQVFAIPAGTWHLQLHFGLIFCSERSA